MRIWMISYYSWPLRRVEALVAYFVDVHAVICAGLVSYIYTAGPWSRSGLDRLEYFVLYVALAS